MPVIRMNTVAGSGLRRGVMNRLTYTVENGSASRLEAVQLQVKAGTYNHISERFSLEGGGSRVAPVVVGGYKDLTDITSLTTTVVLTPEEGATVKVTRTGTIRVEDGMPVLQVLNETFTRGGSGKVRFSLVNTGEEEIEITTARSSWSQPSNEVTFQLLDKDGNVLSAVNMKQTAGEGLVTLGNGNTVARIAAGATFTSASTDLPVAVNAPDELTVRATIANLYYHQGRLDQVKMDGLSGSAPATLIDTAYTGDVTGVTPASSTGDAEITITGRAVEKGTGRLLGLTPLKVVVTLDGFERTYAVMTGEDGTFSHVFKANPGEA